MVKANNPNKITAIWFIKDQTIKQPLNVNIGHANVTLDASMQQEHVTCVLENDYGEIAYFFKLDFLQAPCFVLTLPNQRYVELGQNVILSVNVTGNPIPTVRWLHYTDSINSRPHDYHTIGNFTVHTLILINVTAADTGNYSVVAINSESTVTSETQILLRSSKYYGWRISC